MQLLASSILRHGLFRFQLFKTQHRVQNPEIFVTEDVGKGFSVSSKTAAATVPTRPHAMHTGGFASVSMLNHRPRSSARFGTNVRS
jgi:hypothetical protein